MYYRELSLSSLKHSKSKLIAAAPSWKKHYCNFLTANETD